MNTDEHGCRLGRHCRRRRSTINSQPSTVHNRGNVPLLIPPAPPRIKRFTRIDAKRGRARHSVLAAPQSTINYELSTVLNRSPRIGYWLSPIGYLRSAAPVPLHSTINSQPSTDFNRSPSHWLSAITHRLFANLKPTSFAVISEISVRPSLIRVCPQVRRSNVQVDILNGEVHTLNPEVDT
jgi:hypothetical protein